MRPASLSIEEFCNVALGEKEATMRSRGHDECRASQKLGLTTNDGAQRRLGSVALTLLEKRCGEVGAGRAIVGVLGEHAAERISGRGVVAMKDQHPPELVENVEASRRSVARCRQDTRSPREVIGIMQQPPEIELQIDAVGGQRKTCLDRVDRLDVSTGLGKLPGEFLK